MNEIVTQGMQAEKDSVARKQQLHWAVKWFLGDIRCALRQVKIRALVKKFSQSVHIWSKHASDSAQRPIVLTVR